MAFQHREQQVSLSAAGLSTTSHRRVRRGPQASASQSRVGRPAARRAEILPVELLCHAFAFLSLYDLISASGVCTYWRNSALKGHRLWADIDFADGQVLVDVQLVRSSNAQLHFTLALSNTLDPRADVIIRYVHRVTSLHLSGDGQAIGRIVLLDSGSHATCERSGETHAASRPTSLGSKQLELNKVFQPLRDMHWPRLCHLEIHALTKLPADFYRLTAHVLDIILLAPSQPTSEDPVIAYFASEFHHIDSVVVHHESAIHFRSGKFRRTLLSPNLRELQWFLCHGKIMGELEDLVIPFIPWPFNDRVALTPNIRTLATLFKDDTPTASPYRWPRFRRPVWPCPSLHTILLAHRAWRYSDWNENHFSRTKLSPEAHANEDRIFDGTHAVEAKVPLVTILDFLSHLGFSPKKRVPRIVVLNIQIVEEGETEDEALAQMEDGARPYSKEFESTLELWADSISFVRNKRWNGVFPPELGRFAPNWEDLPWACGQYRNPADVAAT